jgi:hypothetical protein
MRVYTLREAAVELDRIIDERTDFDSERWLPGLAGIEMTMSLVEIVEAEPPAPTREYRQGGRQVGKTAEMARLIAAMTGLHFETVMDLLAAGWSYTEEEGKAPRWTRDSH